jgi:hypothetical protein
MRKYQGQDATLVTLIRTTFSETSNFLCQILVSFLSKGPASLADKVQLKGSIITSSSIDGLTPFLEHTYTVWDRKYGDPRLPLHPQAESDHKYDGKLEGGWLFPFSIPFPTHTDLSTLSAVYPPGKTQTPLQPQVIEPESPITPFEGEAITSPESPGRQLPPAQGQPQLITPFPMDSLPLEKVPSPNPTASRRSQTHITPFFLHGTSPPPPSQLTSGSSAITPYTYTQRSTVYPPTTETNTKRRSPREGAASPNPFEKKDDSNTGIGFNVNEGSPSGPSHPHNQPAFKINFSSLPQSFLERNVKPTIQYELILVISHGKFSSDRFVSTCYSCRSCLTLKINAESKPR